MLRPFVARAKDEGLKTAFNTALDTVNRSSRARDSVGGYGSFAGAAAARTRRLPYNPSPLRARAADGATNEVLQKYYDERRKGGK